LRLVKPLANVTAADYAAWIRRAASYARRPTDARDLLHDALLIAAQSGRADLTDESNRRWLVGVLKRHAHTLDRSETRRVAREQATATQPVSDPIAPVESRPLPPLPRSARAVLALALYGLSRAEMASALRLSDAALRQRIRMLRRALGDADGSGWMLEALNRQAARAGPSARNRRADLLRRAQSRGVGSHDPDGHSLMLS
jgi:RNA polymerase sigma-70 factor (ECF subfamily)